MAWFDELNLPGSTITGHFGFVREDGLDEDVYPDIRLAGGTVTFTPTASAVRTEGAWIGISPVEAIIFEGEIVTSEENPEPPRILSTDADIGVEGWGWRATFSIPGVAFKPVTFKAPTSGVHLTSGIIPIESAPYQVVQGDPGPANVIHIGTVTTGAPDAPAQASMAGESPSQTLSLTIPQGAKGDRGDEGPYGGTSVTDPQVASWVTTPSDTRAALEAAYRAHVSVMEYGAAGDGVADDTVAVQAALDAGAGGSVYFPPGTYRLTGNLLAADGTDVSGGGAGTTVLDWSSKGAYSADALMQWTAGTLTDSTTLAADAAPGDGTLTVPDGHPFEAGDIVRITADEVLFGEMVKAEFQRVLTAEAGVLTLSGPVFDSYSMDLGARVERANLTTGSLSGLTFRGQGVNPGGYGDNAVHFTLAQNVRVTDVRFRHIENKCILADSVFGLNVDRADFLFATSRTPLQYGVAVAGASQMVMLSGMSSWNDRHMVTTSTSQSLAEHSTGGRGIPRVITVTGCTALGSWQAPIDTHRGGEYVTVTGCALTTESTGIKFRGKQSIAVGNTIVGKQASITGAPYGVRIGMLCEDVQITGNLIRGFEDGVRIDTPDGATRGIVVSGNSILDCARPVGIHGTNVVSGVRIAGNLLRANPGGYAVYVIAAVDGLEAIGNTMVGGAAAFYMAHGTRPINRLVVQSNTARGQTASYGMFFRNVYDGLVTSNFSPNGGIRFAEECLNVSVGLNMATISDLSSPGVTYL